MPSRRLAAAIIALGCGLALYAGYLATTGPQPRHARKAVAVVVSSGPQRSAATVSVRGRDGAAFTGELRAAARRYEEAGPVSVLVVDGASPRVYDANGRPHQQWGVFLGVGLLALTAGLGFFVHSVWTTLCTSGRSRARCQGVAGN